MTWEVITTYNNKKTLVQNNSILSIGTFSECDIILKKKTDFFAQIILENSFIYFIKNNSFSVFFMSAVLTIDKQQIKIECLENPLFLPPTESEITDIFSCDKFNRMFFEVQERLLKNAEIFLEETSFTENLFLNKTTYYLGFIFFKNSDTVYDIKIRALFKKHLWCLKAQVFGYGPISLLLENSEITEIMVNNYQTIFIEKHGKIQLSEIKFNSEQNLLSIIEKICSKCNRKIDSSTPYCDARLANGDRIHAIIPPLALDGACLTIRKFPKFSYSYKDLIANKTVPSQIEKILIAYVEKKKNILISGGTGTGKTTLLNCLANFISPSDRIITIEDSAELKLLHGHVIRLETRKENIEQKGQVNIRELLKNTLRMRPDRIIVGECRGEEALDMLQAMNTGHQGSMTTIHSNSAADALRRLETLVLYAGFELPLKAIRAQISSAIEVIIQLIRNEHGQRVIQAVYEVQELNSSNDYVLNKIYAE